MKPFTWGFSLMLLVSSAWSQAITGTILGSVADPSGAVLPAVSVTVTNQETNLTRTALTNASGNYVISNLPVGTYRVEAQLAGFRKEVRVGLDLQVDQRARLDFSFVIGAVEEIVNVNADGRQLQTDDAFVGNVTDDFSITRLPLNGRQFELLTLLSPGVAPPAPGSHLAARGGFNVAGMDEHYNSFFLDGIDNVDPIIRSFSFRPSADLIQEFKIQEYGGNAEFGRNAGGVINVTTKSGTNDLQGSVWEFIRNDNLDARSYFAPAGAPKPPLIRNQFGTTLGGPIRQDRTFFFAAYEGLRQKASAARRATVPTDRMRIGDLSELGGVIRDPLTGQVFVGNLIPPERIHRLSRELIEAYPSSNLPGTRGNRTEVASRIEDGNDVSVKVDHQLPASTRLIGRYSYSVTRVLDPFRTETGGGVNLSNFGQIADRIRTNAGVGLVTTWGNGFANEFRAGYNRFKQPQTPVNAGTPGQIPLMGLQKSFLSYTITGFDTLGSGPEFKRTVNVYNFIDNVSFLTGNHQLKTGFDLRRYYFNSYTIGPNAFVFNGALSGNPLADFLLGFPFLTQSSTGSPGGNILKTEGAAFLQDDWRVHSRLTINSGLRWEFYGRIKERTNKQSLWLPSCNCMAVAGTSVPEQLVHNDLNNFAPRVGLAYRPFQENNTVIRASAGIYYDNDMRHNSEVIGNPPFLLNERYLAPVQSLSFDNPFPANTGVPVLIAFTFDQQYRDTYAEHWSVSMQRELGGAMLGEVAYVGNHVVKARRGRSINQPINGVPRYPDFAQIVLFEQAGSSNFNALQARVERRFRQGFSFNSSYTWGHAIDDRPGQGAGRIQNNYNMREERADADFDVRHRWTLSTVVDLPFGRNRRWGSAWTGPLQSIVGGWGMTGIVAFQGGRPFTVYLAQDNSLTGSGNDRPDLVPGVSWKPSDQRPDNWINPAAFSKPAQGSFGNLGRNTLRGPRFQNTDLAFTKDVAVGEGAEVQVRAEFFNVFNHPNFALPTSSLDGSLNPAVTNFGVISSTVSPERQIQFGLRVEF